MLVKYENSSFSLCLVLPSAVRQLYGVDTTLDSSVDGEKGSCWENWRFGEDKWFIVIGQPEDKDR